MRIFVLIIMITMMTPIMVTMTTTTATAMMVMMMMMMMVIGKMLPTRRRVGIFLAVGIMRSTVDILTPGAAMASSVRMRIVHMIIHVSSIPIADSLQINVGFGMAVMCVVPPKWPVNEMSISKQYLSVWYYST